MQLFIEPCDVTQSPREEMDNIGHIVSWCDDAPGDERPQLDSIDFWKEEFVMLDAGDEHYSSRRQVDEYLEKHFIFLPVYAYIHSGIVLSTSPFSCPWDSGQIGFIYLSKHDFEKHGIRDEQHAIQILEGEIKTYNQYVSGEVIQWVLEDENEEHVDSLCGIYEYETEEETFAYVKSTLPQEYQHLTPERRYPS